MNQIKNIKVLDEIIKKYFVKNTITNNYILPNVYLNYINSSKLFFAENGTNASIIVEKENFYQLYYYINNRDELIKLNLNKPMVMEILYRGDTQKPIEIFNYWEKCGFKQHLVRDNLMAGFNQIKFPSKCNSDLVIKYIDSEKELIFTKTLIENTLDKYTGNILSYDEILDYMKKKNIICAYYEGIMCGILQFEIKNNVVWLGHIAVSPEFRGKGIAKELIREYILANSTLTNCRYQLWVIKDNANAMILYQKFGFVYANKSSGSMLKMN